jgi:DNA mismatch endonuclease vsr
MDNLSPADRHKNMCNIRSKDSIAERIIMQELNRRHIYFAKHVKKILGCPDIVFRRKRVIVFIDSDFWHMNPKKFIMPKTNVKYWKTKITRNQARDIFVNKVLSESGWCILRFWESEIKKDKIAVIERILKAIN